MALFRLKKQGGDLRNAELVMAEKTHLELECHLESWLERSPMALTGEPILWIGRQTSAAVEEGTIFPDLLGIDSEGNVVIVEFKRGKAPREVIAQLLEYAAWADGLSDDWIRQQAALYFQSRSDFKDKDFDDAFREVFGEIEDVPVLNHQLRLFVFAEDLPLSVTRVCRFLRTTYAIDVNCITISTFTTEFGEMLASTEVKVGEETAVAAKHTQTERWSGDKPVKQIVREAVAKLTTNDPNYIFAPKEVAAIIFEKYPNFNRSTITCQLIADCVNHSSRKHYTGGEDHYWWIERGKFRLYNSDTDKN